MKVFVDDKPIELKPVEGRTLGDALGVVQADCCPPGQIVVAVCCDGDPVAAENMAAAMKKPVAEFQNIEVFTSTPAALVIDVVAHASATLDDSETESRRAAELLTQGKGAEARKGLTECLRAWQQIHDAVAKSIGMLGFDPESVMVRDETMLAAIARPRDVLLQIRDALVAGDDVLLADLLQYEFIDVMETWQAILARLRRAAEELRDQPASTT